MEACQAVLENEKLIIAACGVGYMALEAWLGKTQKTEAGSLPELIFISIRDMLKKRSTEDQNNDKAL